MDDKSLKDEVEKYGKGVFGVNYTHTPNSLGTVANTSSLSEVYEEKVLIDLPKALTILRPRDMLTTIDFMSIAKKSVVKTEVWDGVEKEVITYPVDLGGDNSQELRIAYDKGYTDTNAFDEASKLYAYADEISFNQITGRIEVLFNDYLEWRGYKKRPDGSFNFDIKKRVWKAIYTASTTKIRRQFSYKIKRGKKVKTISEIREIPSIKDLAGLYLRDGKEVEIREYDETPPDRFVFTMDDFFKTQMMGKQLEGGKRITKQVVATPKILATLKQSQYQGKTEVLLNYIYVELSRSLPKEGIRNYLKKELIKRVGNYKDKSIVVNKLIDKLKLFAKDKYIKDWGYRSTRNSNRLSKDDKNKKAKYIWIDFNGTPTLQRIKEDFRKKRGFEDNQKRFNIKQHELDNRVSKLESVTY